MGRYRAYIRDGGKGRCDLTLLYNQPEILKEVSLELVAPFVDKGITKVLALESQGFSLGALAAYHLNAGLVFIRKGGKTAWATKTVDIVDYSRTSKTLEIAVDALSKSDKVLIVDDWSETGAQLRGAVFLAEQCGATVIGAAAINMDDTVLKDEILSKYLLHFIELYR